MQEVRNKEELRKQATQNKSPEVQEAIKELKSAPLILPGYEDLTSEQSETVWDGGL